ncbi:SdiA-regulated domain-containing protein [Flavilitoribacter nigricans]|uniref:SdiA-regulated family protein n=1 Tax=Flavilitoribacter nigricans (strain ATCC 23147 / DSM 23189 / NBRC 102662 / NCIMB 1420 / SS-2) TaxID=1122177 RepID=A0A2D0N3S4_FLAN2|nr:SdiA-regulated domain-containing protein [Flavilitoribacter nigricans]PHN03038.1 hypothetical protein CRP01_28555 [Flavilitoribacter nigricans DSM 23189 = NBRC 102662]
MKFLGSIVLIAGIFFGCFFTSTAQLFPYQFDSPDQIFELDDELEEISGLGISGDGNYLLAVQDEDGILYHLDKTTGAILEKREFWKDGDYEGVEAVGSDAYAIKSTGTVYWIKNHNKEDFETEKFNYDLNKDNDVEGLGYDSQNQMLLLACKAHPDGQKEARGIYGFSLQYKQLLQDPIYMLTLGAVHNYLDKNPPITRLEKVKDFFDEDELDFSPSALAVHPISGDLYLLSSKGKMIIVMNRQNEVVYIQKLQKEEHPQPEGLCFDQNGNMYISNEGRGDKGTILVYKYAAN